MRKLAEDEARSRLRKSNPTLKVLGTFRTTRDTIKVMCKKCRHIWSPLWNVIDHQGSGCPECKGGVRLTLATIKARLRDLNPKIKILSRTYTNARSSLSCVCLNCKAEWITIWDRLQSGKGCPACIVYKQESEVRRIIEKLTGWKFPRSYPKELQGRKMRRPYELDGYNKRRKIGFELQGRQHYELRDFGGEKDTREALAARKKVDARKRIQCWRHGIHLICIPYWTKNLQSLIANRLKAFGFSF